jgi:hypothetical protein
MKTMHSTSSSKPFWEHEKERKFEEKGIYRKKTD